MLLKLLLSFTSAVIGSTCGEDPVDTIYISNINDAKNVGSCSVVNASVFIHGENNIGSLSDLNGINQINGDLVITDTTEIRNLKGLHNLDRVEGLDLYLDQYAVVITDNTRLAYIDNINWTSITDYPTDFRNNANVSVVCDPVCNGCFGPGPYLCQECVNTSFYDTNICLSECNEYHLNTSYCHRVAPLPLELYYNTANATCFNFTWSFNSQEPYLETINGVNLLVNDYSIYNYTIDDTGYYYNRNFTDTFEVCGLIPETEYNVTGMLFGNGLMSNHSRLNVATTSYSIENITYVFVGHVNTSTNVLLVWNETQVPGDSYFDSAYSYYQVEITSNVEFNYSNYNLTTRYLIFDLETGLYNIRVRPMMNVTLHNHEYIGEWFSFNFDIFVTPSTTDTSTQTSTPSSTATSSTTVSSTASTTASTIAGTVSSSSSSSSSTSEASGSTTKTPDNKNDDDNGLSTVLIVIIILAVLIFLLLCVLLYLRYNEKKRNDMISRLTGRNRNTDTNPAVAYSNNSFNDPGFTNEDLYSNARYEVGYGDVVVSEESDVGRGAIKNESYDDHYFDC